MQAFSGVRPDEDLAGGLVAPRPVGGSAFHGRNDVHQTRTIAALSQYAGDHVFLADGGLRNVLDPHPGFGGDRRGGLIAAVTSGEWHSDCVTTEQPVA